MFNIIVSFSTREGKRNKSYKVIQLYNFKNRSHKLMVFRVFINNFIKRRRNQSFINSSASGMKAVFKQPALLRLLKKIDL